MSFSGLKHAFSYLVGYNQPKEKELVGHISGLYLYPIKSCRGTPLEEADVSYVLEKDGVGDRHWFVGTEAGEVLTQKNIPSMVLVEASVQGEHLHLSAPGMETLKISKDYPKMPTSGNYRWMSLEFEGIDCGDDVAAWLSKFFKRPGVRLFYTTPKIMKKQAWEKMDAAQKMARRLNMNARDLPHDVLLVISENSVADLNKKLEKPVLVNNFRPNITFKSTLPAYDEDNWDEVFIGDAKFTYIQPCYRCTITTVDTLTGTRDPKSEPYKTLRKVRMEPGSGSPTFGIYLLSNTGGKLKVGDPIYATRKSR